MGSLIFRADGRLWPDPLQLNRFLTVKNEADCRYGIERYSKEARRLCGVLDQWLGQSIADRQPSCLGSGAASINRKVEMNRFKKADFADRLKTAAMRRRPN